MLLYKYLYNTISLKSTSVFLSLSVLSFAYLHALCLHIATAIGIGNYELYAIEP